MAHKIATDLAHIAGVLLGTAEIDTDAVSRDTEQFLIDQSTALLMFFAENGKLHSSCTPSDVHDKSSSQRLFCLKPNGGTIASVADVLMCSLGTAAAAQGLQATLSTLYLPSLLDDPNVDDATKAILRALDGNLSRLSLRPDGSPAGSVSLSSECAWWETEGKGAGAAGDKRRKGTAEGFRATLTLLADKWSPLSRPSTPLPTALDCCGDAEVILDELWRAGAGAGAGGAAYPEGDEYPQARMKEVLQGMGTVLIQYIQSASLHGADSSSSPSSHPLWTAPFSLVSPWCEDAARLCAEWDGLCRRCTAEIWPHRKDGRRWEGEPFRDARIPALHARIRAVQSLRAALSELLALLPAHSTQAARAALDGPWKALQQVPPLSVSSSSSGSWNSALSSMNSALEPWEGPVGEVLGGMVRALTRQGAQLLALLKASRALLQRPSVMKAVKKDIDVALSLLTVHVSDAGDALDKRHKGREAGRGGPSAGSSQYVDRIVWAQGVAGQMQQIVDLCKELASLFGSPSSALLELQKSGADMCSQVAKAQRAWYEEWTKVVLGWADAKKLTVDAAGKLLDFDSDGNVRVQHGELLVSVLRDSRQLSQLGFTLPEGIKATLAEGEKHVSLSSRLARLASFYNTLGNEIIPCTKAMLLAPLRSLESVIGEGGVQWSDLRAAQAYCDALQAKADALADANTHLRQLHARALDRLAALASLDMIRARDAWAACLGTVREVVQQGVDRYGRENAALWLMHLDWQLYKAIEGNYVLGLETFSTSSLELRAEVVLTASPSPSGEGDRASLHVALRPSLEEIRAAYYAEVKRFIALPSTVGSLSGSPICEGALARMSEGCLSSLYRVYDGAEVLMAHVRKVRDGLKVWAAVAVFMSDPDAWIDANIHDLTGYESLITSIRIKRRELDRVQDIVKVGCVMLHASPLKIEVDKALRALQDAAIAGLKREILSKVVGVEDFLAHAHDVLSKRPESVEGISAAQAAWRKVSEGKAVQAKILPAIEESRRMLVTVATGSLGIDTSDMEARAGRLSDGWARFEQECEVFLKVLDGARDGLKSRLTNEVSKLNGEIERCSSRWSGLRVSATEPRSWLPAELVPVLTMLEDWKGTASRLRDTASTLMGSAESFGVARPSFPGLDPLCSDVEALCVQWEQYQEYSSERAALAGQDWLSFRPKLFDLADFGSKWLDAVQGKTKGNPVAEHIFSEADCIKRGMPCLKYARGEPFREEHWLAVFKRLGMPKGVRVETLTVGHFLDSMDAVVSSLQFLKDLTARAQGEVSLREALSELKAWADTAEFKLQAHISTVDGRATSLIKEWRELGAELGDNRQLLSSLRDSPYYRPFADTAGVYEEKLALVEEACGLLAGIQRRWVYLEPVFGRGALPSESARFRRVDDDFRDMMGAVGSDPRVLLLADASLHPNLVDRLKTMTDQLERCQKALTEFLETKRAACPRFYFLGDDDLLEILGQSSNPQVIQAHLKKLFQGVAKVQFGQVAGQDGKGAAANSGKPAGSGPIVAMCSSAGEVVPLAKPVPVTEDVTAWVNAFSVEMASTLRLLTAQCYKEMKQDVSGWEGRLLRYPSQVLCLAEAVAFTEDMDGTLTQGGGQALSALQKKLADRLAAYTSKEWRQSPSPALCVLKCKSLIMDLIHALDVVEQVAGKEAKDTGQWVWQKQLRFYMGGKGGSSANAPADTVVVRIVDASLPYTYEYQGNAPKLVHTPLTDKCYLVLTQGLQLGFGGNPYGPAGTGKTESVKALGAAVGRQVLVFNCLSEEMQVLTNKGFMFLHQLERCADPDLLIAGYDAATKQLLYEQPIRLIINAEQEQDMVEMTSTSEAERWGPGSDEYGRSAGEQDCKLPSNGVSLVVTPGHDMYIKPHGLAATVHDAIVWDGSMVKEGNKRRLVELDYRKVPAKAIAEAAQTRSGREVVSMLAHAPAGFSTWPVARAATDDILRGCNVDPNNRRQRDAFLQCLGMWISDGALAFAPDGKPYAIRFLVVKEGDAAFLTGAFRTLGLEGSSHLSVWHAAATDKTKTLHGFDVKHPGWMNVYCGEFKEKEYDSRCNSRAAGAPSASETAAAALSSHSSSSSTAAAAASSAAPLVSHPWLCPEQTAAVVSAQAPQGYVTSSTGGVAASGAGGSSTALAAAGEPVRPFSVNPPPVPYERVKSGQWLPSWVRLLDVESKRQVIRGIRRADGGKEATDGNFIWTSSVRFREELGELLVQAGFSVRFSAETIAGQYRNTMSGTTHSAHHTSWRVTWSDSPQWAEPHLRVQSDVKVVRYKGRTWCLTMPHGFLVARRAHAGADGSVLKASAPTIIGNCDEGIDFASMGRIFTGLVRCGAWGCFDEFNRLKEDQLSAISSQIALIQAALKERAPTVPLLGTTIPVDPHAGIFVTLNPAGKGYGGRSKLPDNLKALFRPVAMSKPDNELIAETVLASEGFAASKELGKRVVALFTVASQLLSSQQHYDWGLRALKAVLNTAGSLLAQARTAAQAGGGNGGPSSDPAFCAELLIRAIRVNTLSKLTSEDAERFHALLSDVFPGTASSDMSSPALEGALREVMAGGSGWAWDSRQAGKILQLKESLDQRMGCILVGPSGCGKTTLWRALAQSLGKLGQPVTVHAVNPKSMPRHALLGSMDHDTREWTDGVLTAAARAVVREPPTQRCWIVLDGDVDPEWIEALNSVLDDNKLLTLPNGERIAFGNNVNFLFETHDLRYASPATVSRCGMIYISDSDVDPHRVVRSWLAALPQDTQVGPLSAWLDDYFYRALDAVRSIMSSGGAAWDATLLALVKAGLSHLSHVHTKADFAAGVVRGLGAVLALDARKDFARDVFTWCGERLPDGVSSPLDCYTSDGVLKGMKVLPGVNGAGVLADISAKVCGKQVTGSHSDGPLTRVDVIRGAAVATLNVQRAAAALAPAMDTGAPVLLVGPPGCGKGMLVRSLASCRRATTVTSLHCNAATGPSDVIARLRASCVLMSAGSGRVYRPKEGDRLVLLLKDIDLPRPDKYDTTPLVAFLHQLLVFGGFYEPGSREFIGVERVQLVATAAPLGTLGRNKLSPRFTAALFVAAMEPPDARSGELAMVVSSYLTACLGPSSGVTLSDPLFSQGSPPALAKVAACMVELYGGLVGRYTPDEARHYVWSPRDMTHWVLGLLRYPLTTPGTSLLECLAYEAARVFKDRLVHGGQQGAEAWQRYDSLVAGVFKAHFGAAPDLRDVVYISPGGPRATSASTGLHAGLGAALARHSKSDWQAVAARAIAMYEREERELGLTLTAQACETLSSVQRIMSGAGGSAVLIGRSGVGRRSATRVAAHMCGAKWVTPAVGGPSYSVKTWYSELKSAVLSAGVSGEDVVLWVEDHQLSLPGGSMATIPAAVHASPVLEALNSLLCSGELPGLFTSEELDAVLGPLKEEWQASVGGGGGGAGGGGGGLPAGGAESKNTLLDYFLARVKAKLHIFLAMDSHGAEVSGHLSRNPALSSRAAMVWVGDWRDVSCRDIGKGQLGQGQGDMAELAVAIHAASCRQAGMGSGPRDFIALLRSYTGLLASRRGGVSGEIQRLRAGLARLADAEKSVDELTQAADRQRAAVKEKQAAADSAMTAITDAISGAADQRKQVEVLQKAAVAAEGETRARKEVIERELAEITPVLEEAKAAVSSIQKNNLDEIRSLAKPPEAIADVLSAVLLLLGVEDTSWPSMKAFLSQRGVIGDILGYDARSMSDSTRNAVNKVMRVKAESFKPEVIKRASVAAAPLAAWVKAQFKYKDVLEKIAPLEAELQGAVSELQRCSDRLSSAQAEISTIDVCVAGLKAEFGARTAEAETLKAQLARSEETLARAQALLGALSGEQARWAARVNELLAAEAAAPVQVLLAAAFLTYAARAGEDERAALLQEWMASLKAATASMPGAKPLASILSSLPRFEMARVLSSEREMFAWRAAGLPADTLSVENGAAVTRCAASQRPPFLVDPGMAATDWLAKHLASASEGGAGTGQGQGEGGNKGKGRAVSEGKEREEAGAGKRVPPLEVVLAGDARFPTAVELAVRFGKTLLIREADGVPALLVPLLRRDYQQSGPRVTVLLGDKQVDVDENFTMYLASRNPKPILPPDVSGLLTIVNFSVTRSGLEGQLLGDTLSHERPELEGRKRELLRKEEELRASLGVLEDNLLAALATSSGNLLDNSELLASLAATKAQSESIAQALAGSARASEELEVQRDVYRPFARAGAQLFFVLSSLSSINPLYTYSLSSFTALFKSVLGAAEGGGEADSRVAALVPALERKMVLWTCRGLAKQDRLWFALHTVRAMHPAAFGGAQTPSGHSSGTTLQQQADTAEWRLFLGEVLVTGEGASSKDGKLPSWAPPDRAAAYQALIQTVPELARLADMGAAGVWGPWVQAQSPEANWPAGVTSKNGLTPWQRVLLVQALRPDRLPSALLAFVLGLQGLQGEGGSGAGTAAGLAPDPASIAYSTLSAEVSPSIPILLITSGGADPTRELTDYASSAPDGPGKDGFVSLAMGGGVTDAALRAVRTAGAEGGWVYLANLHLVVSWLPTLAKELAGLATAGRLHKRFRLWATTEPHPDFPPALAAGALKVCIEPPPGLRATMERALGSWPDDWFERGSVVRAQLLFLLAYFHALLQERRSFVPQGWTKAYEFGPGDLRAGAGMLDALLPASSAGGGAGKVPWNFVRGLLENSVYGGRIDAVADIRVLRAYLATLFHPDVLSGKSAGNVLLPGRGVLPSGASKAEYMAVVQGLPARDSPAAFGLPDNADRSVQRAAYASVVSVLKQLRAAAALSASGSGGSSSSGGGGDEGGRASFDREAWAARLTPMLDSWDALTRADPRLVGPDPPSSPPTPGGGGDPLSSFLSMEVSLTRAVARRVQADMSGLRRVLQGVTLLTPALSSLATSLLVDITPPSWCEAWDGPEGAGAYLAGLARRRTALLEWQGRAGKEKGAAALLSKPVRLSSLCRPAAFLNALRQATCRAHSSAGGVAPRAGPGVGLDALRLVAAWGAQGVQGAAMSVVVEGLFLQGASMDGSGLVELRGDAPEVCSAPVTTLAWVPPSVQDPGPQGGNTVLVPLYAEFDRAKVLAEIAVPCSADKAKWLLSGVALLVDV